jgi:hypothetical protein
LRLWFLATNELVVEVGVRPFGHKACLNLFRNLSENGALLCRCEVNDRYSPKHWPIHAELFTLKYDEHRRRREFRRES